MAAEDRKPGGKGRVPQEARLLLLVGGGVLTMVFLFALGLGNVLLVILACGVFVLLARTAGDWLADFIGPAGRSVVVATVLFALGWQFISSPSRRAATAGFLGLDAHWLMNNIPWAGVSVPPSSSPSPVQTGFAKGPSGAVVGRASPSQPRPTNVPGASATSGASISRVRMNVVSRSDSGGVRLEARLSGANKIDGIVNFIVGGRHVATASVTPEGTAVAYVANLGPGTYLAEARFMGRGGLGEASSQFTFRRD